MKVLAIDPGYGRMGVAIMENDEGADTLLHSECIETGKKDAPYLRLKAIGLRLEEVFTEYEPDTVAIENLFFKNNQKTALQVAETRGVCLYLAAKFSCSVKEFGPNTIKLAVTGYGSSDKRAVTAMLPKLIKNIPAKALDDEYDAIAIGLTALNHQELK